MGLKETDNIRETTRKFFEPRLIPLGLGLEQINSQELLELRQSLEIVNESINHPESFGVIQLSGGVNSVPMISKIESSVQFGILPLLLERKKLIIERINLLEKKEEIIVLEEKAKKTPDESERSEYDEKIQNLQSTINALEYTRVKSEEQLKNAAKALEEAQSEAKKQEIEEKRERFKLESLERRTYVWQKFLERESIATIVGGLLLIFITLFLLWATTWNIKSLDILTNAFLVILGYFFGQSVSRANNFGKKAIENGERTE